MDGHGLAKGGAVPVPSSPIRGSPSRPFTTVGVVKGCVPTSPTCSKQAWPTLKKKFGAESSHASYMAYATPGSGAADLWKKLARKAELELNLEVDSHRADNAKNNAAIHRLGRRLIPLEKAYGKAKESLRHQEKVINFLKGQIMAVEEKKNMEISYLRSQIETFQNKMAGAVQTNEHQILELQEELHQADSRAGTLQAQLTEIYKNVDDETDTMDGSSTREGTPASQKAGMDSNRKNVHRQNKQNLGLGAVAKIHKLRLSKQYIKEKLKDSEEENALLVQENARLRKLARDAVGRSNKFLDLAQTLKADRDFTMCYGGEVMSLKREGGNHTDVRNQSRLKESEDIVKSLEALKDLVDSYLKTTSPRLGNISPGPHFNKQLPKRQEAMQSGKNTEEDLQLEATGLSTMKAGGHTKHLYSQNDMGADAQKTGESLVKKLQDLFQVETANQTAKTVTKEGEKIRLTMLEAFQELRGQKGATLNTADDVALGVLLAVRDAKHTLQELEKERVVLKASESVEDERVILLESQVHELSMDKLALLELLETVKSTIRAANAGQGMISHVKGLFDRPIIQSENEVLQVVGKLIRERNEARSMGGGLMDDKLLKEKEVSDLRKLHAQSQTVTTHLQVEKDLLKKERNELKALCEDLKREKASWDVDKKGENDKKMLELRSQIQDLMLDRAALLETLDAITSALETPKREDRDMQHVKAFLKRSVVQGRHVSHVVELVEAMVTEKEAAQLKESSLLEAKELKERELDDSKRSLAQIQSRYVTLKEEKTLLYSKLTELQTSAHALRTEKESINAAAAGKEKVVSELQSQLHQLTQERNACRETLNAIKHTFRAAAESSAATEHSEDFLLGSSDSRSGSILVIMAEKLVKERNEARAGGRLQVGELERKEREIFDLKECYTKSKSLNELLQNEKDVLEKEVKNLQRTFRTIRQSISEDHSGELESPESNPLISRDVTFEDMVSQVVDIKEKFYVAKSKLERHTRVLERIFLETKSPVFREGQQSRDWEAEASDLISSYLVLQAEISDLRHRYAECKSSSECLQKDKAELEKEVQTLRNTFKTLRGSISRGSSSLELDMSDRSPFLGDATFDSVVSEVVDIKEKLRVAYLELERDRRVFTRLFQETKSIALNSAPGDWESEASVLISSLKVLQAEKQQIAGVVTACTELHTVLKQELKKLLRVMVYTETDSTSLMESSSSELTAEEHIKADSDFRKMVNSLQSVVEQVANLKRRKATVEQQLQSLELEKEDAVRRSSEHLDMMTKLSNCSQEEVNLMKDELDTVRSLVSQVSAQKTQSFGNMTSEDVNQTTLIMELQGLVQEVNTLRKDKNHLEFLASELRSKGRSEQEMLQDLGIKLSAAEALAQTLSLGAVAAESRIQTLQGQLATAEAQLSELLVTISAKDLFPSPDGTSSSSDVLSIGSIIEAVQKKVFELLLARDEELSTRLKEAKNWKTLEIDFKLSTAEVERLTAKSNGLEQFIKAHTAEWTSLIDSLKNEIARLGGYEASDQGEVQRKTRAMEKVKGLVSIALTRNSSTSSGPETSKGTPRSSNPLLSLATFQVDLLVNNKVHSQLKVAGHNGGLCQATIHYFNVDVNTGEVTFQNAMVPGSQSSNLLVDLFLQSADTKRGYQAQAGDVLGLRVRLSSLSDPNPREVLNNMRIIRADEVLQALQGQMIQTFSFWPDMISSWRWERDARKPRWNLASVRWRCLFKNIFPELSAPFEDMTSRGMSTPRSSAVQIG